MTNNGSVNVCAGTFLDPGGNGNYLPGSNTTVFTICPNGTGLIQLDFTSFDVEANWDYLTVYDGPSTASTSLGTYDNNVPLLGTVGATAGNASGCLTFEFYSVGSVNLSGWEATISCATPCQNVQANMVSTNPSANASGEINICQGDMVSFVGSGIYNQNGTNYTQSDATSTFAWDFGDGSTATGTNTSHTFPNEGAYYVELVVTDINGCVSTNSLTQLIQVSTTPIFAGTIANPDTICLGQQSTLTGVVTPVPYQVNCVPSLTQPLALPDGTGVTYQTCVNLDCYLPGQTLTNINDFFSLCMEMEHSYMGDLQIELTCPTGQNVVLVSYPNGGGNTFLGIPVDNDLTPTIQGIPFTYCFTPTATSGTWTAVSGGVTTLPAGNYNSEQPLSNLVGCELNGDWCISITDNLGSDNGFIFSWGIDLNPALAPPSLVFTPVVVSEQWQADPSIVSTNGNNITVQPSTSGNQFYTYEMTDDFGCTYDTTISIYVLPSTDPSCTTPCVMTSITALMTNCYNTPFLQYDMTGEVTFTDPPLTGQLIVQNCFGFQEVFNAPFTSPQSYSFTALPQDGQLCDMTAYFTDDPSCTITGSIQAPPPITYFSSNCTVGAGAVDGTIEFTNPNNVGGTLVISISDGTTTIDTVINPPFTSPQTWSISGLNPAANPYVINYYFSGFPTCGQQQTINCGCSAEAGTSTVTQTGSGINNYILCENDQIVINTNNDYAFPDDIGPIGGYAYQPAMIYLVYTCPPTPGVFPGNDPCFYTLINSPNNITQTNDGTSVYDIYGGSTTFPTQTLYFTPITLYHYDPVLGNYIVNSNCWDIGDITQVTFLSPIISTITPDCQTATVDVVISGGYPELFGGNFTASNLQPATATFANTVIGNGGTITIVGLQNGDMYSFDIVDDNGCPHSITGGPFVGLPTAYAGTDDQICTLTYGLSAVPSFGTGTWTGPGTFAPSANDPNATVTVATAGTYTFTWTEDNGGVCVSTDDVIISFSDISYVENVVSSTCGNSDGEITLIASYGITPYQYSIDNGANFQTAGLFPNLFSGTYNILITDAIGCQISGTATITDQGGPVINSTVGVDVLCLGSCDGSIAINATGATLFSIDNGANFQVNSTFTGLCSGIYDIVVQDNFGCQSIDQVTINEPLLLTATIFSVDLLCSGVCTGEINVSAQGGTLPYQYSIDGINFMPISVFSNLCAGNYNVIVEDNNGCQTVPQPITIIEPPLLTMTLGVTDETCFGACDGMINSIPAGGTGPGTYTYSWTVPIGSVPLASNLCIGSYSLTVTDANGCTITADTVINGPQAVNINSIDEIDELCGGDCLGSLTVNAVGATQYSLDGINFQAGNTFNNLCAGNYTVYVQDASACVVTSPASISGPTPVDIQAFNDTTICIGGSAQLSALSTGGVGGYTYTWDNNSFTQAISVSPIANQVYCVTGTDANGCSSGQICLTVSVNPALNLLAFSDLTICLGDSASISSLATGGDGGPYTYSWDQGLGIGQNQTVGPTATTVYSVTATDGCETPSATASVTITVSPIPTVSFIADTLEGCMPLSTTFTSVNVPTGSQCIWNFGDGGASTDCGPVTYTYTSPGCWDVGLIVTTPEGCVTSFNQTQYICVYEYPTAAFTFGPQPTTVLNTTIDFVNNSSGATSYLWIFDVNGVANSSTTENPSYTFPNDQEGSYQVCLDAINDFGCLATICNTIVINEEFLVYVPNAFTPEDGNIINDLFHPVVTGVEILEYEFYIFNRWGELIYESYNPGEGWDGRYQGVMSQQDAYVWKLIVIDQAFKKTHEYVGHVILLK